MKNFSHQHFLFRPEFMNFNQINSGVFGINICTIMQNYFYGCDENWILTQGWHSRREASSCSQHHERRLLLPW